MNGPYVSDDPCIFRYKVTAIDIVLRWSVRKSFGPVRHTISSEYSIKLFLRFALCLGKHGQFKNKTNERTTSCIDPSTNQISQSTAQLPYH